MTAIFGHVVAPVKYWGEIRGTDTCVLVTIESFYNLVREEETQEEASL